MFQILGRILPTRHSNAGHFMTGRYLAQTWIDVRTLVDRNRTARAEAATEGGLIGVGTSPCSTMRSRVRVGSGIGIAESSACV